MDFISETSIDRKSELINQSSFKIGIQSYSNVGRIFTFEINLQEATVTPDDYVWQEINFNLNGYQASVKPSNVEKMMFKQAMKHWILTAIPLHHHHLIKILLMFKNSPWTDVTMIQHMIEVVWVMIVTISLL